MKFFFLVLFSIPLLAQRSDFFDSYDYDLRNQKIESGTTEVYQIYKLPPKRPKRELLDPKKVQKSSDLTTLIPQSSPFRSAPQTINLSSSPVNLLTGELNTEAILKDQEERKKQKEAKIKAREEFSKVEYTESVYRRGEIIFFMTYPFALVATALLVGVIENSQKGFIKTQGAVMLMGLGSVSLSFANVWLDYQRNLNYQEAKKLNPNLPRPFEFLVPIYTYRF